jgi:hypothetical protein
MEVIIRSMLLLQFHKIGNHLMLLLLMMAVGTPLSDLRAMDTVIHF